MKASDYIVAFLEEQGIEYVFGYQGGMITHLVDSLSKSSKVKFIQCYHEQSAAFAAEGYARATGKFGVCITTSGPGATNTITSIGNAYFDSIPVLYITGQVNSFEYKYDSPVRQKGFQETDIVSIVKPITKYAVLCDDAKLLASELRKSVAIMTGGRKGPVVLDLPMNVQRAELTSEDMYSEAVMRTDKPNVDAKCNVQAAIDALCSAKRPLVICGGGLSDKLANDAAKRFLDGSNLPYAVSLMGKGLVDEKIDRCVGMIGSYGNRCANMAFAEADVVLALGSRLDLRQTGNRKSALLGEKLFVRVDIDSCELDESQLPHQLALKMDVASFCDAVECSLLDISPSAEWLGRVAGLKKSYSQENDVMRHVKNRLPYEAVGFCAENASDDALFVADIGQNQMWAAQMVRCGVEQGFYTSGGMAPMGYAIPAAAGAAFAKPDRQVVCFCGDGGMHISVQSLMLVSQYHLPVSVIVFNNHALGMITQFQSLYFNGNLAGTARVGGYLVPSIKDMAAAYGLPYFRVSSVYDLRPQMLSGPKVVEIDVGEERTTVVPKLEFDHDLDNMTPPA